MSLDKSELKERLIEISSLYAKTLPIKRKMELFKPKDVYERSVALPPFPGDKILMNDVAHEFNWAIESMRINHSKLYAPKKPEEPKIEKFREPGPTKEESEILDHNNSLFVLGIFTTIILSLFSAIACLLMFLSKESLLAILLVAALPLVGIFLIILSKYKNKKFRAYLKKKKEKALADYNFDKELLIAGYNKAVTEYEDALKAYNASLEDFLEKYKAWREIYLKKVEEEKKISALLVNDRKAGIEKIREEELNPIEDQLLELSNDVLSYKYWSVAWDIYKLIENGRADDVKEAINVYEEIQYRERQLQLQIEQDEQRQREEMLRRQDEERRHREGIEMERNRQYEERRMREVQLREEQFKERQRREQEARDTRMQIHRQCSSCALSRECRLRRPNCASYKPR